MDFSKKIINVKHVKLLIKHVIILLKLKNVMMNKIEN